MLHQNLSGPPRPSPRWPIQLSSFSASLIPPRGSTFLSNQESVSSCDFITRQEMATKASPASGMGPLPSGRRVLEIPETVKHLGRRGQRGGKVGFPTKVIVTTSSRIPTTRPVPTRAAGEGKQHIAVPSGTPSDHGQACQGQEEPAEER